MPDNLTNPFLNQLKLTVKLSPIISLSVLVLHFIALSLPWYSGLPLWAKIMLNVLLILSLLYYLNKYYLTPIKQRIVQLVLNGDDHWQVNLADGTSYPATLEPVLFVHPLLTIITLKFNHTKNSVIFTPDMIEANQFRRLRVRLRFKAEQ